jgi:two-component system alkaline phosphatase synthesis response regulator PhoP
MSHILILSEQQNLIQALTSELKALDYITSAGSHFELGIDDILREGPDLILFDLTRFETETVQLYQGLKNNRKLENLRIALLILVSESSLPQLPISLEFDDLLLVPYKTAELQLRINRLLWQRDKFTEEEVIKIAELAIYPARYEIRVKNQPVELTFKEYELLKYLATHPGRAFNRESLLNIIWGYDYHGGTRTVDVHIRRIRAKIGDEQETYIKTVRGVGYMFRE